VASAGLTARVGEAVGEAVGEDVGEAVGEVVARRRRCPEAEAPGGGDARGRWCSVVS